MDELERLIAKIPQPTPSDSLDQRIEALLAQAKPLPAARRKRGLLWVALASAAAAAVALSLHLLNPDESWAEVAAAVQSKPWIHLKTTAEAPASGENWISFSRDVAAMRCPEVKGELVRFEDFRTGVKLEYEPATKKLYRLALGEQEADSFQALVEIFRAIFRGETPSGEQFAEQRIVGRKVRTVEEGGRKWQEYELELQTESVTETMSVVIRAAPDTKLPVSVALRGAEKTRGTEKTVLQLVCDYPEEGPADIYALGVPRDTPIEDRVPPAGLAQIIHCVDGCRRDLDNYFAAVVAEGATVAGQGSKLVWRKGDRWRTELIMPPPDPRSIPLMPGEVGDSVGARVIPLDATEREAWCREHLAAWLASDAPRAVCDGREIYHCGYGDDGLTWKFFQTVPPGSGHLYALSSSETSRAMIEFEAYPQLVASARTKLSVDPAGPGGPAGSTLVEVNHGPTGNASADDNGYHTERYWLDPARGYVVLKSELSNSPAINRDPARVHKDETYEFEEFRQSPRGIWYPTVVRHKHASGEDDQVTYYYLDFAAPLPDELFTPVARPAGM